ncbi:hypothetical protein BFX05_02480 [Sulfobacillus thermosulfidooxidans]|nr:hypothetical protein BFX05_02480 [Sulfobacillus thermosulfidooxidans]
MVAVSSSVPFFFKILWKLQMIQSPLSMGLRASIAPMVSSFWAGSQHVDLGMWVLRSADPLIGKDAPKSYGIPESFKGICYSSLRPF